MPITPVHVGIGDRIRAARVAAGLSQASLATAVGVSRSAVAQWETGRSGQVGVNLVRIAELLGVSAEHLLRGMTTEGAGPVAEDATEVALLRLYRSLNAEDRQLLLRTTVRLARARPGGRGASVPGGMAAGETGGAGGVAGLATVSAADGRGSG